MKLDLYVYKATVVKVYDASTITVLIDLGLNTYKKETIILENIKAPEINSEEGVAGRISRDALRAKILDKEIILRTKRDKTGIFTYLGTVFLADEAYLTKTNGEESIDIEHININDWLVENKYAEHKEY